MAHAPLHTVVRHLQRVLQAPAGPAPTDAELLERFARQQDVAAFELLVWRHQRMVFGVCRRVLRDAHDAEDAFQATFLTLVRKAGSIKQGQALAGWLYQVAYRIAWRAHAVSVRRRRRELPGADLTLAPQAPDSSSDLVQRELAPVLDRELQALPAKYRQPLVLCYLEGKTYDEAAEELGCPKGTLSTRLTRGRELLRAQLTRRGLALSAAALATALGAEAASAAAPAALVATTVQTVAPGGTASAQILALTQGVLQAMFWTKMKVVFGVALTLAMLGAGSVLLVPGLTSTTQAQDRGPGSDVGGPAPGAQPGTASTWRVRAVLKVPETVQTLALSPDGNTLVAGGDTDGKVRLWDVATGKEIALLQGNKGPVRVVAFSPDGRVLAVAGSGTEKQGSGDLVTLWDVPSYKTMAVIHDAGTVVVHAHFSRDGRLLATVNGGGVAKYWVVPGGQPAQTREVLPGKIGTMAQAPDGKLLAVAQRGEGSVFLVELATGKVVRQLMMPAEPLALAFSPDGKSLAVIDAGKGANQVRIWDVASGQIRHEAQTDKDTVRALAFSPDGKLLATGGQDQTVRLWDPATGKLIGVLKGHDGPVVVIIFAPNGATLITASGDRTVRIWDVDKAAAAKVESGAVVGRLDSLLRSLLKTPKTDEQIIEALCLATMARLPTEVESRLMLKHVAGKKDRLEAFTDVLWALVNSQEFHLNVEELRKQDLRQPKH
jgi:RNA polymerase sigma factor (sigma-70 family)